MSDVEYRKINFRDVKKKHRKIKVEFYIREPKKEEEEMKCPRHPDKDLEKLRFDVYGCSKCGRTWLIHKLSEEYPVRETNEVKP